MYQFAIDIEQFMDLKSALGLLKCFFVGLKTKKSKINSFQKLFHFKITIIINLMKSKKDFVFIMLEE
jgi:hypothetical protein